MPCKIYNKYEKQDELRQNIRLVKAENPQFTYKEIAQMIGMNYHAFMNFMSRQRNLSKSKVLELKSLCDDMLLY